MLPVWSSFSSKWEVQDVRTDERQQRERYLFLSYSLKEGNFLYKEACNPLFTGRHKTWIKDRFSVRHYGFLTPLLPLASGNTVWSSHQKAGVLFMTWLAFYSQCAQISVQFEFWSWTQKGTEGMALGDPCCSTVPALAPPWYLTARLCFICVFAVTCIPSDIADNFLNKSNIELVIGIV